MDVRETEFVLSDFRFASGESLSPITIHYRTLGTPRTGPEGQIINAVLMLHGTVGGGEQFLAPETADFLFGKNQPLDPARYFVILPDAIGHGGSSKPSDVAKNSFPKYTYGDMVEAQYRLITEGLGVRQLRLLIGTSMGGMHTWMWAERFPNAMRALMPIACVPGPVTGRNLLWRRMLIETIVSDAGYHGGDYREQPRALGVAWNLFQLMADSAANLEKQITDVAAADARVKELIGKALSAQDANDVVYEFAASQDYDPWRQLAKIAAPLLAVNFADDQLNPVELQILDDSIKDVKNGRAVLVPAGPKSKGHQTLQVAELWSRYVVDLLGQTEAPEQRASELHTDVLPSTITVPAEPVRT